MVDSSTAFSALKPALKAGIITKICLENFMCHSSLQMEFGEFANFITGQNGSGKSAILTALCIAFGCRARGTQRAATLKDFIKTGCSYAAVHVELKNQGEDAFKPEIYGDLIIIERRISGASSSTALKDHQGKRVSGRKDELRELVEHFNIDVENPCVIMTQDKSREFLHSGSEKDKFKFFFKATLLQQVSDLLEGISHHLKIANEDIDDLEKTIRPVQKELNELQGKIKNMEHVEEISQQVQQLRKKLAWSWVYDVDRELQDYCAKIEKLKDRIPTCQAKIDKLLVVLEELRKKFTEKKSQIACMMETASEGRRMKDELQQRLSLATKEKLVLEEEYGRKFRQIEKKVTDVTLLEKQVREIQEQHVKDTQAEEFEIEKKLKDLQSKVDTANSTLMSLMEEENDLSERQMTVKDEIKKIAEEIEGFEKKLHEIHSHIRQLEQHQSNKVTAFGGERVLQLLRAIERHNRRFRKSPIGPIGAHLTLVNGDTWAPAVEVALGNMLNAFIVTDHKDSLVLRECAREAGYNRLQIFIYDFSRPRLSIPQHMLPQTNHPTTFSVLQSDSATVINVLVDLGNAERQVLVKDYEAGKNVAFDRRVANLKEVYTLEGHKMFSRGSVETILPPNKRARNARLCSSFDDQIKNLQREASTAREQVQQCKKRKRDAELKLQDVNDNLQSVMRRRSNAERELTSRKFAFQDAKNSHVAEATSSPASSVDELIQEVSKLKDQIQEDNMSMEDYPVRISSAEEKARYLKVSFESLSESARGDIDVFEKAESELMQIEKDIHSTEAEKAHYEGIMENKVLPDIKLAEADYKELQLKREESCKKASIICAEIEVEALGGVEGCTPDQLSAQLTRLIQRLQRENQQYSESIDDLRMLYEHTERKISRKQQMYKGFRDKLNACQNALELRWNKFQRNATLLKRDLTNEFNSHLGKKGISGKIKISYEQKSLALEVKMPQDTSSITVRDTRGLSGGERSFSTLCFALALHHFTEAPFRAMDEFDVFMDAVSRKISLDTLVDFALTQGSQWIFITPHDISMVKQHERVKKQQMAAPRS